MNNNHFRIIAGQWRGRKLSFIDAQGLRPTLDRVRETLFNWLQGIVYDSYCLDLFSGSGSLAFEALSRGAKQVDLVDNNPKVVKQLNKNLALLNIKNAHVVTNTAIDFIKKLHTNKQETNEPYQLVFLDPPFHKNLLQSTCKALEQSQLLSATCYIYIEVEKSFQLDELPANWIQLKYKKSGQLAYYLYQRQ